MARGWVHTILRGGEWVIEVEGEGPITRHQTRLEAVDAGKDAARALHTEHVIHDSSGAVAEQNSYSGPPT